MDGIASKPPIMPFCSRLGFPGGGSRSGRGSAFGRYAKNIL
jgi:hypothetical protein